MSTLKAARADNFYRPSNPSVNSRYHQKGHPLGHRAKGNGVIVVRYETPFNMNCLRC